MKNKKETSVPGIFPTKNKKYNYYQFASNLKFIQPESWHLLKTEKDKVRNKIQYYYTYFRNSNLILAINDHPIDELSLNELHFIFIKPQLISKKRGSEFVTIVRKIIIRVKEYNPNYSDPVYNFSLQNKTYFFNYYELHENTIAVISLSPHTKIIHPYYQVLHIYKDTDNNPLALDHNDYLFPKKTLKQAFYSYFPYQLINSLTRDLSEDKSYVHNYIPKLHIKTVKTDLRSGYANRLLSKIDLTSKIRIDKKKFYSYDNIIIKAQPDQHVDIGDEGEYRIIKVFPVRPYIYLFDRIMNPFIDKMFLIYPKTHHKYPLLHILYISKPVPQHTMMEMYTDDADRYIKDKNEQIDAINWNTTI